jgi:acetyl-CoA synthetase
MNSNQVEFDPDRRVLELLSIYDRPAINLAALLCDRRPTDSVAYRVIAPDLTFVDLTYGELKESSERLAHALSALGVKAGDRVATLMGKSRLYLISLLAIWRLGAVHVPLFTAFAHAAIRIRLDASGCRIVICDSVQKQKLTSGSSESCPWKLVTTGSADKGECSLEEMIATEGSGGGGISLDSSAPFIQIYTSGTTGSPKGVAVPIRALASFQAYAEFGLGLSSDGVFWNAADPGWAYGLYFGILATLTTGVVGLLFESGFSAESTLQILSRFRVTHFAAAPTVYRALRASTVPVPEPLPLRCSSSAGEPLTPDVNEWALAQLGVEVFDHYGQTEAGMLINNHHHSALRRPLRPGSMGLAMPGWKAVVLAQGADDAAPVGTLGRVAMDLRHSPFAWFGGYCNDPEKSAEKFSRDGEWYLTGDLGRVDADGYFYFSSREDDVIIMAGYRIGPLEVESVILRHNAVSECAVVAVPDEIRGEVLEAVVVLRQDFVPTDELTVDIQAWVKKEYAAHAYPRRIHYVQSLPKTPSGKLQRYLLRQQLKEKSSGNSS